MPPPPCCELPDADALADARVMFDTITRGYLVGMAEDDVVAYIALSLQVAHSRGVVSYIDALRERRA